MFNCNYIKEIESAKELRMQRFINSEVHEKVTHLKVNKLSDSTIDYLHDLSLGTSGCPSVPFKIVDVYFRKVKSVKTLVVVVLPEGDPWKVATKALYVKRIKVA